MLRIKKEKEKNVPFFSSLHFIICFSESIGDWNECKTRNSFSTHGSPMMSISVLEQYALALQIPANGTTIQIFSIVSFFIMHNNTHRLHNSIHNGFDSNDSRVDPPFWKIRQCGGGDGDGGVGRRQSKEKFKKNDVGRKCYFAVIHGHELFFFPFRSARRIYQNRG